MKKQIAGVLGAFMGLMLLFTFLSRAADSVTVPRVQAGTAQRRKIVHTVSGSGKVEPNRERAVRTEAGQIVTAIAVREGTGVEEGDLLFEIDTEELKKQILQAEGELEKLKLQQQDAESQAEAEKKKKQLAGERAAQDYQSAVRDADRAVARAQEELSEAKKSLEQFKESDSPKNGVSKAERTLKEDLEEKKQIYETAKEERKELEKAIEEEIQSQIRAAGDGGRESGETELFAVKEKEVEAVVRKQYEKALTAALKKEKKAEKEQEEAEQTLKTYQEEEREGAARTSAAAKEQLMQAAEEKQEAYEAALAERENSLRAASRGVEDAGLEEGSDSTDQINEIDRKQKELELLKLYKLQKAGGKIYAPVKGVITKISIAVGERTADGMAVMMADLSQGCRLVVQMPADQEKYIAKNDPVTVTPSGGGEELENLRVETVCTNEEDVTVLDVSVQLPGDFPEIGTVAQAQVKRESETYRVCVPVAALYQGEQNQYYVLLIQEEESVLGTQTVVKRQNVTIRDKNGEYAALTEDSISEDQKIVVGSDRVLSSEARVRVEEP